MPELPRGLYESILTKALEARLRELAANLCADIADLRPGDAADRIALHIARLLHRTLESLPEESEHDASGGSDWDEVPHACVSGQFDTALRASAGDRPRVLVSWPGDLRAPRVRAADGDHVETTGPAPRGPLRTVRRGGGVKSH